MITILFSTFNGEHTLPRMLHSLEQMQPPSAQWELIVVDNGSTDRTGEILRDFSHRLPLRCLYEPVRGKNRALNRAINEARGDLLLFTDDDVIVDSKWLCQYEAAIQRNTHYDLFGGAIAPCWEQEPPPWLLQHTPIGITYGITNPDIPEGPVNPGLIWGANMLVRRRVFDIGLRFNEQVGPAAGQYVMGSETEFNLRVTAAGFHSFFLPHAQVYHIIRPHQLQTNWVLARAFRFGRNAWNQEQQQCTNHSPTLFGVPRWRLRSYADHYLHAKVRHLQGQHQLAFKHDWELYFLRGYFKQAWTAQGT